MTINNYVGWLLDLFADPQDGVVLWLLGEDGTRYRLRQHFPVAFYAAGPSEQLRQLWAYLASQPIPVRLARRQRQDLFQPQPVTILAVTVENAADQPALFFRASRRFPDLNYYDTDLPITLRYAAAHDVFPLARCRILADQDGWIQDIIPLESRWDLDPRPPPLRILQLTPDRDPYHALPELLHIAIDSPAGGPPFRYCLPFEPRRPLIVGLRAILRRHDPDLLLTTWGDTWLLPHLMGLAKEMGLPLHLNRETNREVAFKASTSYFSYGQVIFRGQQVHLFGRFHIDRTNAMMFGDYGLEGALEMARITTLPLQVAARVSPGSGISTMQMWVALRRGVMVPWNKQQAERPKSAMDLIRADQGGMVYQPLVGLHKDVAEVDFISMYPSIMAHFNISPETVGDHLPEAEPIPQLNCKVDRSIPGLVPETLRPLLAKRIALKNRLAELPLWHPDRDLYKARASAQKWLLVVCFGYLGYKNARFGRIEAHEAVTAYGRELLLRGKEASEDQGYEVLHLYVDGMWVRKPGVSTASDLQPLLEEISRRTELPIALEGIYRWVAFLPSRVDARLPVPNRYFGVFQDGSIKMRGIEARRRDTAPYVAQTQLEMLCLMAQAPDADCLPGELPGILAYLRHRLADLRAGRVPLEDLIVGQKMSRELEEYVTPSPAARAAAQLEQVGKPARPGQRIRFLYTRGDPGVCAWDLPEEPNPATIDVVRYTILLVRAASTALQPLGVSEDMLQDWLFSNAGKYAPPGIVPEREEGIVSAPAVR